MICKECKNCWNYMVCENGCYGSDKPCEHHIDGENECADSRTVQKALGMSFEECFSMFSLVRIAEWWSIAGKTEEEKQRNGQKIEIFFRKKTGNRTGISARP